MNSMENSLLSAATPLEERPGPTTNGSSTSLDKAVVYLRDRGQPSDDESVDPLLLLCKVDWRIVPLVLMCYAAQFIDKVNINVGVRYTCLS